MSDPQFEGWAIVELLGHRQLRGQAREVELFGSKVLRLEVTLPDGRMWPQFYTSSAIYAITPATAEQCERDDARRNNQSTLIRLDLATPEERADYENWYKAEQERRRQVWAEQNRLALQAPDDDDGLP